MALTTVRPDLAPAPFFKRFDNPTGDQVLHLSSGAAPTGIEHLPCGIFVRALTGEVLHLEDVLGNISSTTFAETFIGYLPCAPAILGDETTCEVTVFWNAEP